MIFWVSVSTQPGTPLPLIINREHLCFQTRPCFSQLWQGLGDCLEADPHRKKKKISLAFICVVVLLISAVHFPLWHRRALGRVPVLCSRCSLVVSFTHSGEYVSIQSPNSSHSSFPLLGVHTLVLFVCVSISALRIGSSVPFSRFRTYALIYDICFSLSDLLHSI